MDVENYPALPRENGGEMPGRPGMVVAMFFGSGFVWFPYVESDKRLGLSWDIQ